MRDVTVNGYIVVKNGKYSKDVDTINKIFEKADFMCQRNYNMSNEYLDVCFYGWNVNTVVLEDVLLEVSSYISDGDIEIFDKSNNLYTHYYYQHESKGFSVYTEGFDGWYDIQPLAPEDSGFIKTILINEIEKTGDTNAMRLLSRFEAS